MKIILNIDELLAWTFQELSDLAKRKNLDVVIDGNTKTITLEKKKGGKKNDKQKRIF